MFAETEFVMRSLILVENYIPLVTSYVMPWQSLDTYRPLQFCLSEPDRHERFLNYWHTCLLHLLILLKHTVTRGVTSSKIFCFLCQYSLLKKERVYFLESNFFPFIFPFSDQVSCVGGPKGINFKIELGSIFSFLE